MKEFLKKVYKVIDKYIFIVAGFLCGLIVINTELITILIHIGILGLFTYLGYRIGKERKKVKKILKSLKHNIKYTVEDIKDIYYEVDTLDINDYMSNYNEYNESSNEEVKEENKKEEKVGKKAEETNEEIIGKVYKYDNTNNNEEEDITGTKLEDYNDETIELIDEAFLGFKELQLDDTTNNEINSAVKKVTSSIKKSREESKKKKANTKETKKTNGNLKNKKTKKSKE